MINQERIDGHCIVIINSIIKIIIITLQQVKRDEVKDSAKVIG